MTMIMVRLALTRMAVIVAMRVAVVEVGGIAWRSTISPLLAGVAMTAPAVLLGGVPLLAFAAAVMVYAAVLVVLERLIDPTDLNFAVGVLRRRLGR